MSSPVAEPLPRRFFEQPTTAVARQLLGCRLVRQYGGQQLSGLIVETEAYCGPADPASHARSGAASRSAPMFGAAGHAYVYFTYGLHYCLNVVTEPAGVPGAVLLRAIEPEVGLAQMQQNRGMVPVGRVANGPAKLCQAISVDRQLNQHDLTQASRLWIEPGEQIADHMVKQTARIGIRRGREFPWRWRVVGRTASADPRY